MRNPLDTARVSLRKNASSASREQCSRAAAHYLSNASAAAYGTGAAAQFDWQDAQLSTSDDVAAVRQALGSEREGVALMSDSARKTAALGCARSPFPEHRRMPGDILGLDHSRTKLMRDHSILSMRCVVT